MSNLLDKSSLVLTPTAYNNGKILSVKPSVVLGEELVTNGDFSNGSTGWTIINGTVTDKYNASMTSYQSGIRIAPFSKTGTFKVVFDLVVTSGSCKFDAGGSNNAIYSTSGTKEIIVTNTTKFEFNAFNLGWVGTLDNVSVKEEIDGDFDFTRNSSATRVNSQGLIEDITSNLPRIDYTGGVGHWLFEPQSTNLIDYSEDISQSSWIKQSAGAASIPSVTPNFAISPEGTQNASRVVFDLNGGTTSSDFSQLQENISGTVGNNYTSSIYLKSNNSNTYSVTFIPVSGSTTIISVTPDWQRFEFSAILSSANMRIRTRGSEGSSDVTDILIWGAQLEQQSFATSYIPTNGEVNGVTRLQDAAFGAGSSDLINSTEGTLYAEIAALSDGGVRKISISDGSLINYVSFEYSVITNLIRIRLVSGGVEYSFYQSTSYDYLQYHKIAISYKINDFKIYIDGLIAHTDTSSIMPIGLNVLNFSSGNGAERFFGKTKCLAVFKEALTETELTCLTTI